MRVCNIDEFEATQPPEIAFFHHRSTLADFDAERRAFVMQCCGVLRAVAAVYDYPHYVRRLCQLRTLDPLRSLCSCCACRVCHKLTTYFARSLSRCSTSTSRPGRLRRGTPVIVPLQFSFVWRISIG